MQVRLERDDLRYNGSLWKRPLLSVLRRLLIECVPAPAAEDVELNSQ